jgi:hypothetical protein
VVLAKALVLVMVVSWSGSRLIRILTPLSRYAIPGLFYCALELAARHPVIVVGDLDDALRDIRVRALDTFELVQLTLHGGLTVTAAVERFLKV